MVGFERREEGSQSVSREPVVTRHNDLEWETWSDEDVAERGLVYWKTLVSRGLTPSNALTMGIAKIPPGEALREHRHQQAEIYLVLEGTGLVRMGGKARAVEAGDAVFIPGNVIHSCENPGATDLRFAYVFPADSFEEIEYIFGS